MFKETEGKRNRRLRLAGLVAAGALAAATVTGTALGVVGGQPDNGAHPYVGMVAFLYDTPDGVHAELCSGSLLSPRVFVTAAHCVPPESLQVATLVTFVENDAVSALHNGPFVPARSVSVNEHYCPHCGPGKGLSTFDTHDVAVVQLAAPVDLGRYAQLPAVGQANDLGNKAQVQMVGYGLPDLGYRETAPANVIPGGGTVGDEFLKLSSNLAQGKGATCSGDSGGPDLLPGTDTILAISGYGPNTSCNAVEYSQRLDVPDVNAWLASFLR